MNSCAPIRVAFPLISRRRWAGGYNYQRNLFSALAKHRSGAITSIVFAGQRDDPFDLSELERLPGVEIVQDLAFDADLSNLARAVAVGKDAGALASFAKHDVDVAFESARFYGWRMPIPAIAWIPDVQHRSLPHLFSRASRLRRDLGFRLQIASGRTVMLSSHAALSDYRKFYPGAEADVSVVRFVAEPSVELLTEDPLAIAKSYELPDRFFFLPNQFWRHKNHQLVIDALSLVRDQGVAATIALTGSSDDPRDPNYFSNLIAQVETRGLDNNFRYLGMVPLSHVYALLRVSAGLINPSRFEGWSTTVEEAKSFGVPLLLSDIAVHREQALGQARYFDVDDAPALARHLIEHLRQHPHVPVRDLRPDVGPRVARFADDFVATVERALRTVSAP